MKSHVAATVIAILFTPLIASGQITMNEVATAAGIGADVYDTPSNHGLGINWIDYDNDGWPDLYVTNGIGFNSHLFHNEGDGTFTNQDALLPVLPDVEESGSYFADYDNDGDKDIYITVGSDFPDNADGFPNRLLKNLWVENGNQLSTPLFEEVAVAAGVDNARTAGLNGGYNSYTGGWLDYDLDGCVDLFVGNMVWDDAGLESNANALYHNECDGTFTNVTATAGINDGDANLYRPTLAYFGGLMDDDMYPDIYVINVHDASPWHHDVYYHNNGDGTFTNATATAILGGGDDSGAGMGIDLADIELDGDWDMYMSDLLDPGGIEPIAEGNVLYTGNSDGTWNENSAPAADIDAGNSWAVNFLDLDQDGYEELLVGMIEPSNVRDQLFLNNTDGTFTDISISSGMIMRDARGAAVADYDRDGDLDFAIVNKTSTTTTGALLLYQNNTPSQGNWLEIDLVATISNRSAIGALIEVSAGGLNMMRQVKGGVSAHSQDDLMMHFGLGTATTIDNITVTWPSGVQTTLTNEAVNQRLVITEDGTCPNPTASFTTAPGATSLDVDFDASASSAGCPERSIVSYDWDFDDGNVGTGVTTSHSYAVGGAYTVSLTVTDSEGATGSTSQSVTVGDVPPVSSFTFATTDLMVDFTDTSTDSDGTIVSWDWDFGDLNTSISQNPSHTYAADGTYTVTLTVTDDDGLTDLSSQDVTVSEGGGVSGVVLRVNAGGAELASEDSDPAVWEQDDVVSPSPYVNDLDTSTQTRVGAFTLDASVPAGTPTALFETFRRDATKADPNMEWDFPVTANEEIELRLYFIEFDRCATGGRVFDVEVEGVVLLDEYDIFDDAGCEVGIMKSFVLTPTDSNLDVNFPISSRPPIVSGIEILGTGTGGGNVAPTASFTFTTTDLLADFTDTSTDSDGTIASWSWDFGDTNTSTVQSPSHTYAAGGTYTVELTVTDDGGLTDVTSQDVTVTDPGGNVAPTASFTFTTTDLLADFTDTSTDSDGTIASWSWDFGDTNTSTVQSPSHTYAAGGTYTVELTVTDDGGLTDVTSQDVTVTDPGGNVAPTASFTFTTTDLLADFTDTSTDSDGTIASWSWDFGDTNTSTEQSPSHTYATAGTFTVELTVTDDGGLTDVTSQDVTVTDGGGGTGAFIESGGLVVMEAENFHTNTDRSDHSWSETSALADASGGAAMEATPDDGTTFKKNNTANSPEMTYDVDFSTTGTYYVWVRLWAPNTSGNSVHIGVSGGVQASKMNTNTTGSWVWTNVNTKGQSMTFGVSTSDVHPVSLWVREDGVNADKLLLTSDAGFVPTGQGPAESPRTAAPQASADATAAMLTSVSLLPTEFGLEPNYPNPFGSDTRIRFALPEAASVSLEVYDMLGRRVSTLVQADLAAGRYDVRWDGTADTGAVLASGMYLYRMTAGEFVSVRQLVIVR